MVIIIYTKLFESENFKIWILMIFAIARTTSDYVFCWNFYFPKMDKLPTVTIMSDDRINKRLAQKYKWKWHAVDLYATKAVLHRIKKVIVDHIRYKRLEMEQTKRQEEIMFTRAELETRYKNGKLDRLWDILDYCRQNRKPVIIASIPSRSGAIDYARSNGTVNNIHQIELKSIAKIYDNSYFDGYTIFVHKTPREITNKYWLKYDSHWGFQGSQYFAKELADYILSGWNAFKDGDVLHRSN